VIEAPRPPNETQRLETLHSYDILDTPPEAAFDRIVAFAARLFNVPIVTVSLVAEHRQWFKACIGLGSREADRKVSFCAHALLSDDVLTVLDAWQDERFHDNPLVTGDPHIRFYAGAPLVASDGSRLGTLCLIDREPHTEFTAADRHNLSDLASTVSDTLELRRATARAVQAEETVERERQTLKETFAALEEGVVVQNVNGEIISANESCHRILGLSLEQMMGLTSLDPRWRAIHPDGSDFPGEAHPVPTALKNGEPVNDVVMGIHHPNNSLVWISVNARPLFRPGESKPYAAVGSFFDITERQQKQEFLEHLVHHDTLTDLPNRLAFQAIVTSAMQHHQTGFAIGFLDLNGFKPVNDRYGHDVGDELLKQVAKRLRTCLRESDIVARFGGDEFTLFLARAPSSTETDRIKARITAALEPPFQLTERTSVRITASLGFAYFPNESTDLEQLLKLADNRMYAAKNALQAA
jgi:diguanylate cyclase (GGDEF)-like protein/PAS domain S-box-containing protein